VLEGEMTAGMIFAASIISGRGLQPIDQLIGAWRQLVTGWQGWTRLRTMLSRFEERTSFTTLPAPEGRLEAQEIFVPNSLDPSKPPILQRVSFVLPAGRAVAVLGPSGSGKSTLARVIVGAIKPRAGHVRIDGHDIANWDPEELGRHVGYLAQEVELIPGTIAENISRFEPTPDDEDIVAAARLAHVEDLIRRLPRGYDTPIGPGGMQISGGERQRIGLARALYGSPKVLVLDEPNSNLDRIGELALMHALRALRGRGVTVFIITQRENVLPAADMIMRMQNGAIVDFDERDKVIAKYSRQSDPNRPDPNQPNPNQPSGRTGDTSGEGGGEASPQNGASPDAGSADDKPKGRSDRGPRLVFPPRPKAGGTGK
jgi:PrtD family type I secretion system ABC transporter